MHPSIPPSWSRRRYRWTVALGSGVLVLVGFGWWVGERGLPQHQGRTVRSWFLESCRREALARHSPQDGAAIEAKLALLEMGTNAVPFLVREAFTFRRDTALRTNLHRLFRELPDWASRGAFIPYADVNQHACTLLRLLRPAAPTLLPLIEPHLRSLDPFQRRQATFLAGAIGQGAEAAVPYVVSGLTNRSDPWLSGLALQSLKWLGASASNALPAVVDLLDAKSPDVPPLAIDWLGALGPVALPAVPRLEPLLTSTNARVAYSAAIALANIEPGHSAALRLLTEAVSVEEEIPDGGIGRGPRGRRDEVMNVIFRSTRRPNEQLAALIEPVARAEIAAWGPQGASFVAGLALERVSPSRAAGLYRSALEGPGASYAAWGLLRVERTNELAAQRLLDAAAQHGGMGIGPIQYLGEASSSNRVAWVGLSLIAAGEPKEGARGRADAGFEVIRRATAGSALANIRYREARQARGLPENEWW